MAKVKLQETEDGLQEEVTVVPFRAKRKPGPVSQEAPLLPAQDLADAAAMLKLMQQGLLRIDLPKEEPDFKRDRFGRRVNRLSAQEETQLAHRVQIWGDIDARNTLVLANIGLVHLVANQHNRPWIRYEDLVQEGVMGLIRATESFEPKRGIRFSTYSVYWIRAKIQRLLQRNERDDTPGISGAPIEIDEKGKKYKAKARKMSLERTSEEEDGRNLSEVLSSETHDPEQMALLNERSVAVKAILEEIVQELDDPRLFAIIEKRLLAEEPQTLSDLGEKLNLSREGARLLEAKMLKMARDRLSAWKKVRG